MLKRRSRIKVTWYYGNRASPPVRHMKILEDWFDFADWVQQENLHGKVIAIVKWEYVPI